MRNLILLLLYVLCGIVMLAACGSRNPTAAPPEANGTVVVAAESKLLDNSGQAGLKQGDMAADFVYALADGTSQKLSDLRGKKVLLNFWATWCGPCVVEMPEIQRALAHYGDQELAVLGVSNEDPAMIETFAREHGISFPLIANRAGDISDHYSVPALPTSFFINRDGTIYARHLGPLDQNALTRHIEAMQ